MTRDDLGTAYAKALARHAGQLRDTGGRPGPALLADLAAIAERHADDRVHAAMDIIKATQPEPPEPGPVAAMLTPGTAAKTPARRTPARRTAKE